MAKEISKPTRVLMLLENNTYRQDGRVRNEALALTRAGYLVSVISPRPATGGPFREDINGVRVYYFPAPPELGSFVGYVLEFGYATLIMALLSLVVLLRDGFDVLHTHNPPDTFFWLAALYKLFGKKFVFDQHDLSPEMYNARTEAGPDGASGNRLVTAMLEWCERQTCRVADWVIATNGSYKALEITRNKVPPERISIVRNGPNLAKFNPCPPDPALRKRATTLLAYVGEMGPQDGIDYLMRALHQLVHVLGQPDVLCILMGDGAMLPTLKLMAQQLRIENNVWFTGRVSQDVVIQYVSSVDICVDPDPSNPYNDRSTMIKIMEYMALCKPIVAFDLPEHRVSAGDAAIYAQPNDELAFARHIQTLSADAEQCKRMGQIGRQRVESELAWCHQEKHLLETYRSFV